MFNLDNADWQYLGRIEPNDTQPPGSGKWTMPGQGWLMPDSPGVMYRPPDDDGTAYLLPNRADLPDNYLTSSQSPQPGKKRVMAVRLVCVYSEAARPWPLAPLWCVGPSNHIFSDWLDLYERSGRLEMGFAADNARCRTAENGPWDAALDYSGDEYRAAGMGVYLPSIILRAFKWEKHASGGRYFKSVQIWIALGERRNEFWTHFRASREL